MRIAISGSHATGKSTLVTDLCRALPAYAAIDEPYYELLEEGEEFADRPSVRAARPLPGSHTGGYRMVTSLGDGEFD